MKDRTVCSCCLNDSSVRNIGFDENKLCNFCKAYEEKKDLFTDYARLEELFCERLERVRGKYAYDAVVGISGGKDSVYLLYQLIHKYKLKVKAFTMLNGFFSDEARKNVDSIVGELGVEHEYIEYDDAMLKTFYHYSMKHWLVPCIACSYIGYATMVNYASRVNAGMCIHGRSPEQMLRAYGKDVFTELVDAGLESIYDIDLNELYGRLLNSIGAKLDRELMIYTEEMLTKDMAKDDYREFVAYFLYHPYKESEIVDFLRKNTSWQPPAKYDHYDCRVHNAARYIYQTLEGRPHALPEISTLVRLGDISKEEGSEILCKSYIKEKPTEELDLLCRYADINKRILLLKARVYNAVMHNRHIKK